MVADLFVKGAQTMKCKLWTETLQFWRLKVPNSRFALHGTRPSLIHGLCAFFASNSRFMRLFQAALDTPVDSPFSATLSVHGLHFTVCAPSSLPNPEKETPEVFGKIEAGEFTLNNMCTNNEFKAEAFLVAFLWPSSVWKSMFVSFLVSLSLLEEGKRPPPPRQDSASGLYWGPAAALLQDPSLCVSPGWNLGGGGLFPPLSSLGKSYTHSP